MTQLLNGRSLTNRHKLCITLTCWCDRICALRKCETLKQSASNISQVVSWGFIHMLRNSSHVLKIYELNISSTLETFSLPFLISTTMGHAQFTTSEKSINAILSLTRPNQYRETKIDYSRLFHNLHQHNFFPFSPFQIQGFFPPNRQNAIHPVVVCENWNCFPVLSLTCVHRNQSAQCPAELKEEQEQSTGVWMFCTYLTGTRNELLWPASSSVSESFSSASPLYSNFSPSSAVRSNSGLEDGNETIIFMSCDSEQKKRLCLSDNSSFFCCRMIRATTKENSVRHLVKILQEMQPMAANAHLKPCPLLSCWPVATVRSTSSSKLMRSPVGGPAGGDELMSGCTAAPPSSSVIMSYSLNVLNSDVFCAHKKKERQSYTWSGADEKMTIKLSLFSPNKKNHTHSLVKTFRK